MEPVVSEQDLLRTFLGSLLTIQNVDRGSIWVKSQNTYRCLEALGDQSDQIKGLSIGADRPSIVGWVIETGQMTISRPEEDERHFSEIEDGLDVKSTLILCFPLIMREGRVYGAIELIDTSARGHRINLKKEQLALIENLVSIGSIALSHLIDYHHQLEENQRLKETLHRLQGLDPVIGQSRSFLAVIEKIKSYAQVDFPVLITGESGTGKDVLAREIHRTSPRRDRPFLVQNCSAIPDTLLESELFGHKKGAFTGALQDKAGLFKSADGGTLFLDEIGDMPFNLQARLLRVLQDGEIKPVGEATAHRVDVRIVAATNTDLAQAIVENRFREDLFFRLNVLPVHIPPLRKRKEDIPLLFNHFLSRECLRLGLKPKIVDSRVWSLLMNHPFRGNVRELENLVRHLIVLTPEQRIGPAELEARFSWAPPTSEIPKTSKPDLQEPEPLPEAEEVPVPDQAIGCASASGTAMTWAEMEQDYVRYLLEKTKWNVTRAARLAGLKRSTFDARMRRLGLGKTR